MVKLCGTKMWCCMSNAEVEQGQLAVHFKDADTTLIDDAMRIVLQHLPEVAAVTPVSLVSRSAAAVVSMHKHRHHKRLKRSCSVFQH